MATVEALACTNSDPGLIAAIDAARLPDRVVVINDVSVVRGGATGIALTSIDLLAARGVPVTFIAGDDGACADTKCRAGDFIALGGRHILERRSLDAVLSGLYNREAEHQIARWIAANDTPRTVYHLHGWSKVLSPAVFRALRPVAPRLVISAHDFFLVCPNGGYFNFQSQRLCSLRPMGLRCFLTSCDRRNYAHKVWRWVRQGIRQALCDLGEGVGMVLAVHEGMIAHLEDGGVPRHKLRALRNPVVPWRRARVQAERNRTFVFVGRLDQDKGIDLLAGAARRAGVPLRIIGNGPLRSLLATRFPEAEQVGWKTQAEIADLTGDARVVVMPTRVRETLGLVALEALTSGLPVVVSSHAMIADEIANAGFGFSCDPHDEAVLAATLTQLAHDDGLVACMSHRAHAGAWSLARTPAEWTTDLLATYRTILQRATRNARGREVQIEPWS